MARLIARRTASWLVGSTSRLGTRELMLTGANQVLWWGLLLVKLLPSPEMKLPSQSAWLVTRAFSAAVLEV